MIFVPLWDMQAGCASFVIGDTQAGAAVVVDPLATIGVDAYVLAADQFGCAIEAVMDTHVHADHLSAALELAHSLHLRPAYSHHATLGFAFEPLHDGHRWTLGSVAVTVWETPGHTPDSLSVLVADSTRGQDVWAVLTGDCLFPGDVGRPDLVDASDEGLRQAAHRQWDSLQRLLTLPDYVEVYPAHFGTSACGGIFLSGKPVTTVGFERRWNRFLQVGDADAFADTALQFLKPPPPAAARIRAANGVVTRT